MSCEHELLATLRRFVAETVGPALRESSEPSVDRKEFLGRMGEMGLFGLNIPRRYGGLEADPISILRVMEELSRGWMCLPSVLGSHMRAAPYILAQGTEKQRAEWLPALARGESIWAHGYGERRLEDSSTMGTNIVMVNGAYRLNGQKDWVTNALESERIVVVARFQERPVAVVVNPARADVTLQDLERPGMKGVSLCRVSFQDYELDPEWDIVGGPEGDVSDVLRQSHGPKALAFAARAVGATKSALEACREITQSRVGQRPLHPVAQHRWGRIVVQWQASKAIYESALAGQSSPAAAKVFCAESMREILEQAVAMLGGDGYAHPLGTLERLYRDALSLTVAGGTSDRHFTQIAAETQLEF
jgi:alkylation response protein AidB-like acyl-CoA dehydrogenase